MNSFDMRLAAGTIEAAAGTIEAMDAEQVLAWGQTVLPRLAVTSSFGADSAVLLHLVARVDPYLPVLFLDTGFHFPETLRYRRALTDHLGLRDVRDLHPSRSVQQQALRFGDALYRRDPDRCCAMRKVAPLDAALTDFDGWATGIRRDQTVVRAATPRVQTVIRNGRPLIKLAPLAAWTAADVQRYLTAHRLPRHPLVDRGYLSIGCAPCTLPVENGQGRRSGRWADSPKTECGLHCGLSV